MRRTGTRPSRALPVAAAGWTLVSAALAATGTMPANWMSGTQAAQLSLQVRDDPALCGLALYDIPFVVLPGRDRLVGRSPIYAFRPDDPAASGDITAMTRRDTAGDLPPDFARRDCASIEGDETCIFARSGSCDTAAATRFVLNDVLARVGIRGAQVLRPPAAHRPAG